MIDQYVIGLAGPDGVGKTSVATALIKTMPGMSTRLSFADPLRKMAAAFLMSAGIPNPNDYLTDRKLKEEPIPGLDVSMRTILRTLGTEWGRDQIRPSIWSEIGALKAREAIRVGAGACVIFDDVRFITELEAIQSLDRMARTYVFEITREGVEYSGEHQSDAGLKSLVQIENPEGPYGPEKAALDIRSSLGIPPS